MTECIFCSIAAIKQDILREYGNFFAKVGVGILAPGHVMLIPKLHISCFGALPPELEQEFLSAKDRLFREVESCFSEPLIFEHGAYSQSVKHAHLHFLPRKGKFHSIEGFSGKIFRELRATGINSIFEIRDVFRAEGSYLYIEENGEKRVFHTRGMPEGKFTFRKEFARVTGIRGLEDWRTMGEEEEKEKNREWVRETKERMKAGN